MISASEQQWVNGSEWRPKEPSSWPLRPKVDRHDDDPGASLPDQGLETVDRLQGPVACVQHN